VVESVLRCTIRRPLYRVSKLSLSLVIWYSKPVLLQSRSSLLHRSLHSPCVSYPFSLLDLSLPPQQSKNEVHVGQHRPIHAVANTGTEDCDKDAVTASSYPSRMLVLMESIFKPASCGSSGSMFTRQKISVNIACAQALTCFYR
jgi:hypothetical protein